ncbi:hypothetical protein MNBD_ALPHA04-200 [hydrothermal vent metagenome]|uniref:DUF4230 domain-containing protein n=1 Tax=hydrothermal vent metagenome TaxID=652676 RepID=A0A3B0T8V6_9ZZZZ
MNRKLWVPLALASGILLILGALAWLLFSRVEQAINPDPVSIADASLSSLREQNRLIVFEASYNASVTTTLNKLGLSARKTLIMPGNVRYEIDMAKLTQDDVRWDAENQILSIQLPAIEIAPPQVQIERIQTYDDGGILMALTDAENVLDQANRRKGVAMLAEQAKNPVQMRLAREAARRAVSNSFILPMRAAGIDARIDAFFPYERDGENRDQWDLSRPIKDVLAEQRKEGVE